MSSTDSQYPNLPLNFAILTPEYDDQLSVSQTRMVVDVLRRGGITWFMSDCAYAAGVDPRHVVAVGVLDALLDHAGQPIPVTVADEALAADVIRFDRVVRVLTATFWPGGLGIRTRPATRLARRLSKTLHCPEGVVVRMSRSIIERQISSTARLPITSAALRSGGNLVTDTDEALALAIGLHEERTPGVRTIFIRDVRRVVPLAAHSTMVGVEKSSLTPLRRGSIDFEDTQRAALSDAGVDWSDAT